MIKSHEDMHNVLNNIYTRRERRPLLNNVIVVSRIDPTQIGMFVESDKKLSKKYAVELVKLEEGLYRLSIERKSSKKEVLRGEVLIDVLPPVWVITTTASHRFVEKNLKSLLRELYPEITPVYLNYSQLLSLLERIKGLYEGQSFLTSFAIGREIDTPKGVEIERVKLWRADAIERLLEMAKEKRIWIEKLNFKVKNKQRMILLDTLITSRGTSKLFYGNFTNYYNNVLKEVSNLVLRLNEEYEKVRRRVVEKEVQFNPCTITYFKPFRKEHFEKLVAKLTSDYMVSISYRGNPYLAVDLLDYHDGSSFGLTILGNKVTISPMLKTTNSALWKLSGKIQDVLGGGEIVVAEIV
jgi:HEPN domain-containing protein